MMLPSTEVSVWQSSFWDAKKNCTSPIYGEGPSPRQLQLASTESIQCLTVYKLAYPDTQSETVLRSGPVFRQKPRPNT